MTGASRTLSDKSIFMVFIVRKGGSSSETYSFLVTTHRNEVFGDFCNLWSYFEFCSRSFFCQHDTKELTYGLE